MVEVLVAFVVLALSLGAFLQVFATGMHGARSSAAYDTATTLAESKLARLGVEDALEEGETTGRFDDRFRWRVDVRRFTPEEGEASSAMQAYRVDVTVLWGEAHNAGSVSLTTLRLGPAE